MVTWKPTFPPNQSTEALPHLLHRLDDSSLAPDAYGEILHDLGAGMGELMARHLDLKGKSVFLTVTVEEMDNLGAGMIEALSRSGANVRVACLWLHRSVVLTPEPIEIARIIQQYVDERPHKVDHLIVLESIIASSCGVRTSIMRMLSDIAPGKIHVVSTIMAHEARSQLERELSGKTMGLLDYWTLAMDASRHDLRDILKEGGNPYERLGFKNQDDKNFHMPEFIAERIRSNRPAPKW